MDEYGKPIYGTVREQIPLVTTKNGVIQGENRDGVAIFRGIPYGENVDGKARFLPPKPVSNWLGVRDCCKNGPIAVQFGTSISGSSDFGDYFSGGEPEKFGCEEEVQGENCLVLNILTPGLDHKQRPVLVYIHGGGFSTGSGTLVLGADRWVKEEDIVVVGVNHRLNVFGYLNLSAYDPQYKSSGIVGILDLLLALQWVHDNISVFGGDPEKVTIMGESGGGAKVNHLLAMKAAKGLFRSAIVESGSGLPATNPPSSARAVAKELLAELNIPETQWEKILDVPAEQLLKASAKFGMSFSPSADGEYLAYNKDGEYWEADPSLPLLVGASADEVAAFAEPEELTWEQLRLALLGENQPSLQPSENQQDAKGRKKWSTDLPHQKNDLFGMPAIAPKNVDYIIQTFRNKNPKADAYHLLMRIRSQCNPLGSGAYCQEISKAKKESGAIYGYYITFLAPHPRHPEYSFAWHTADLPLQMRIVLYPHCENISKEMAHSWAAFIRTGSPSTDTLDWPPFLMNAQKVMVFDDAPHVEEDPTRAYRECCS